MSEHPPRHVGSIGRLRPPALGESGQALVGIVIAIVVLGLLSFVALNALGGTSPRAHHTKTASGTVSLRTATQGTALAVMTQTKDAALVVVADSILDAATTLGALTGNGPGAVDPSSAASSSYLQVAAGDARGEGAFTSLRPVGGDRYEMSEQGAVVCITAPTTETARQSVVRGRC